MIEEVDVQIATGALALLRSGRISVSALREILATLSTQEPMASSSEALDRLFDMTEVTRVAIAASFSYAVKTIQDGLTSGIVPIPFSSPRYPSLLRSIGDPPPLLYVRGNVAVVEKIGVAVVGTRKATGHGLTIATRIAKFFGDAGYPIVSGLALGIDAAAHEGALLSASPTVAVLAHGLEKASPRANAHLADRILEAHGAWVSEHPLGTPAKPENFVHRNRIQVGLSCASVIVEGQERSGSMTQAEFCIRNRRSLFAVLPVAGSQVSIQQQLPRMLVQSRGATAIRSKDDYPAALEIVKRRAEELARESPT